MSFENIEQWRKEFKRLRECRAALDGGELHAVFEAPRPHLENYVKALISQFGENRLNTVLGHTVRDKDWDGRFDNSVKAWAANQPPFEQPPRPPESDALPRNYYELVAIRQRNALHAGRGVGEGLAKPRPDFNPPEAQPVDLSTGLNRGDAR